MVPATNDLDLVIAALHEHAAATGETPLMLGGWEVEDAAIGPPAWLVRQLKALKVQPEGYAYSKDFAQARLATARLFQHDIRLDGQSIMPEHVAVLPNSSQGLLLALTALREQGVRHAVIAAPCYFAAIHSCHHLGLDITLVPAADFLTGALDLTAITRALGRKRAVLIVTNPAYSIGVTYAQEQLAALFALLPKQAYLLLDETRLGLNWNDDAPWYRADYPAKTLILRSPSKIFLLNGIKTSVLLGPAVLMRAVEKLGEMLLGSVAGNAEAVALTYIAAWQEWYDEMRSAQLGRMRGWKAQIVAALRSNLHTCTTVLTQHGLTLAPIDSGPYVLATKPRATWSWRESDTIAREIGYSLNDDQLFLSRASRFPGLPPESVCG